MLRHSVATCDPAHPWMPSASCCAIASPQPPPSTPRRTRTCSARLPSPGSRQVHHAEGGCRKIHCPEPQLRPQACPGRTPAAGFRRPRRGEGRGCGSLRDRNRLGPQTVGAILEGSAAHCPQLCDRDAGGRPAPRDPANGSLRRCPLPATLPVPAHPGAGCPPDECGSRVAANQAIHPPHMVCPDRPDGGNRHAGIGSREPAPWRSRRGWIDHPQFQVRQDPAPAAASIDMEGAGCIPHRQDGRHDKRRPPVRHRGRHTTDDREPPQGVHCSWPPLRIARRQGNGGAAASRSEARIRHPLPRADVGRHVLALSTCPGHAGLSGTFWYLEATPTIMQGIADATERLHLGQVAS